MDKFKELLKGAGVSDVDGFLNQMKENKIFLSGEDNIDVRYGKLKTNHESVEKQLFCDEPSTGLDPVTARSLDELLLELRDTLKVSMVIVSHELESIKIICDRFVYLKDGYVLKDATLEEGMQSDDPTLRHFFNRQCPKEEYSEGLYHFNFID